MLETNCFDGQADRALDLAARRFEAQAPNRLWVADFTYVFTWEKLCFAAFVIDVFSRWIVCWRVADSMRTELVLDASEMALWSRGHEDCRSVNDSWFTPMSGRNTSPSPAD